MENSQPPRKILVIDDDPTTVALLEGVLTSNGYQVITAMEAPAGLEMAMKGKPDLIVLDVMMPIINGFNICRLMKSELGQKNIPIVLLTSRSGDMDKQIGQDVGANAYIAKPFRTEDVLDKIREILAKSAKS